MMAEATLGTVVEAVQDLTRVLIAINGSFVTKADAVRKLDALSIPPARIAAILAMPLNSVSSTLTKAKQKTQRLEAGASGSTTREG